MLDINIIRENPDLVRKALVARQEAAAPVDLILQLDERRRAVIQERGALESRAQRRFERNQQDEGSRPAAGQNRGHARRGRPDQQVG